MTIKVTATDIHDAAQKLGLRERLADIKINWRRGEPYDYQHTPEQGCIVDATSIPGEEVKRCFKTSSEAVRYIAAMLKKHDALARDTKAKRDQELRNKARLAKAMANRKQEAF